MTGANRWLLWAPFAVAAVILGVWYAVWLRGADAMRSALADFAAGQARDGAAFSHAPLKAKGFPFFLRGEIGAAAFERGEWRWEAEAVYLHASPWAPDRILISAGPSMRVGGPGGVWTILTEGARASMEAAPSGWLFKAETARLEAVREDSAVNAGRGLINLTPAANEPDAYAISFRLFDTTLKTARGETRIVRVDGALSLNPAARSLAVHGLDVEFRDARAELSGSVAAGGAGYLEGSLGAAITNPAALAEALRIIGAVKSEETRPIEASLALLAAAGGGKIEAPIVFASGETRIAGIKIGKAPKTGQP